jgi:hypothetical protein
VPAALRARLAQRVGREVARLDGRGGHRRSSTTGQAGAHVAQSSYAIASSSRWERLVVAIINLGWWRARLLPPGTS